MRRRIRLTVWMLLTVLAAAMAASAAEAAKKPSNIADKPQVELWPVGKAPGPAGAEIYIRQGGRIARDSIRDACSSPTIFSLAGSHFTGRFTRMAMSARWLMMSE